MKYFDRLLRVVFFSLLSSSWCFAEPVLSTWYLPQALNDRNTSIRFEVDSTWHLVHGDTSGVTGKAILKEESDPTSVQVSLSLPVSKFDTNSSSRDERMNEVMFSDKYPSVTFVGEKLQKGCTPAIVRRDKECRDELKGTLTLLATTKEVVLPLLIKESENEEFVVEGSLSLRWAEYGIEDPSIFIAHLNPVVTVFFKTTLAHRAEKKG